MPESTNSLLLSPSRRSITSKQFDLNVLGLLLCTRGAVKSMPAEGGAIVNISSIVSPMPVPNGAVYCASKAAVDAITIALSMELGPKKIRINSVNPGMVETEGLHSTGIAASDFRKQLESTTPLGRIAQPEDIAKAVVFFATDDAGWVTGQTLVVAGGQRQ
ncbi:MAG: SDR family oxidoreductase [Paludibaculum sp.]